MTEKETLELFEIHQNRECNRCPNNRSGVSCSDKLVTAALELIKRKDAKIAELESSIESLVMELEEGCEDD